MFPPSSRRALFVCFLSYVLLVTTLSPFTVTTNASSASKALSTSASQVDRTAAPHRQGEILVRFRAVASQQLRDSILATQSARRKKRLTSGLERLELPPGRSVAAVAMQLRANPEVEFAEPNYLIKKDDNTTNDLRFGEQWALKNIGQDGGQYGSDINVTPAWQTITGAASTVIAVVDSGIDFTHPDLVNNKWTNPSPSASGDHHGWDFVNNNGQMVDEQGHGTAVAGIIAAEGNNGVGISGVMWRASLMNLRVLDNTGTGDVADAVEAIDYASTHGAQVINLSWGTSGESLALRDAIARAIERGVVVVCSAGNSSQELDANPYYPSSFDLNGLISVAGSDSLDQLSSWSNWSASKVQVAAPGTAILTTQMGGGYGNVNGTSAAAPLVTGAVGLIRTARPALSVENVTKAISDGSRKAASLASKVSSGGVVDVLGALTQTQAMPNQSPTTPTPGYGTGGTGPGGSFSTTPPPTSSSANNLPNIADTLNQPAPSPSPRIPIQSNMMCADCDPQGGGGGGSYYPTGDPNFSAARQQPANETGQPGVDLGSRNFNWSLPIVNLPGRAGLDLSLTLSYNSLVWTKDDSYIKFNADLGSPAPGFRLGLPILQQRFFNSQTSRYAYMLVTPSGGRVELRQVGSSNIYESEDGNYTQLDVTVPTAPVVRTSDGTRLTFIPVTINSEFRCVQVRDRNGNFLSATYNTSNGHLLTITDTLGRLITFFYDTNNNLHRISQSWGGINHDWATFYYGEVHVQPPFPVGVSINGPANNDVTVLTKVKLADESYYTFNYSAAFAQVNRINRYAPDDQLLAYTSYDLDSTTDPGDCPRVKKRRDWAKYWNSNNEAETSYSVSGSSSQTTTPDGTVYKEFYGTSGWQSGLTTQTEVWSGGTKQKWTTMSWTQDNTGLGYQQNPRVTETNVYDAVGNRRRMTIAYGSATVGATTIHLPETVREYAANASTVIRRTVTGHRWESEFTNQRIIGLVGVRSVYGDDTEGSLLSKLDFHHDWANNYTALAPSVQHDSANYSASFTFGRGNLVGVRRYNKNAPSDDTQAIWIAFYEYDLAGSVLAEQRDINVNHKIRYSYSDSFSDGNNSRGTRAYRTTITDPDSYQSTVKYNFDTGAITRSQDPKGAAVTVTYDAAGRVERVTNEVNNAYKRFVYWSDGLQVLSYETLNDGVGAAYEAYSTTVADGAGRVRATAAINPGSTGGFMGRQVTYDVMGRVVESTNPTEMDSNWTAAADDATAGWVKTLQTYDWKSRPLLTTRTATTTVSILHR